MLELAIGDAYGAGFEYVRERKFITENNNLHYYVKHPRHTHKPGTYTDDAQMSIAIAELILESPVWKPEIIAGKFVDCFHRDKRPGYAGGFYAFLKKTKTAKDFLANIKPHSDKSGAAMRACPIGVYPNMQEVINRCTMQASLTHNTDWGTNAAVAASLMTHFFLNNLGNKNELPTFLCRQVQGNWNEPWRGEVGSRGWMSVRAAITSIMKHDSLSKVLKSCIAWGGDTDTVATIAMGAASFCNDMEQDLPENLISGLENKRYGRDYLIELDAKLNKLIKEGSFR